MLCHTVTLLTMNFSVILALVGAIVALGVGFIVSHQIDKRLDGRVKALKDSLRESEEAARERQLNRRESGLLTSDSQSGTKTSESQEGPSPTKNEELTTPQASGVHPTQHLLTPSSTLIRDYHARSLAQSHVSFLFAIGTSVAGFVVIIFAVATVVDGGFDKAATAGIQIAAAVVVEAVAGMFFAMSNKSRTLLANFFDKLRVDNQYEEALRLARDMPPGQVRERLHAALALGLTENKFAKTALAQVLGIDEPNA